MRKLLISLFSWTTCAILSAGAAWGAGPQRIISLKPNITEILFAIGAGDRVVGVTTWCNYPSTATALPKVADYVAPNVERVLALQPDLVIGSKENGMRQPIEHLQRAGISVALFSFDSIAATTASITAIGEVVGVPIAAQAFTRRWQLGLEILRRTWTLRAAPRVVVVVSHLPLIVAGPRSFLGELLVQAHGDNIVTTETTAYPHLSMETLLRRNPEVAIDITSGMGEKETTWWRSLATVEAVQHQRVVSLPTELFRPGPRLVEGLRALGVAIHLQGLASPPPRAKPVEPPPQRRTCG